VFVLAGGRVVGTLVSGGREAGGRVGLVCPCGRVGFVFGRVGRRGRLLKMSKMSPGTLTCGRGRSGRCGRGFLGGGLWRVRGGGVVGALE
jgi:hypothetical protein